jgi:hypothetical protein
MYMAVGCACGGGSGGTVFRSALWVVVQLLLLLLLLLLLFSLFSTLANVTLIFGNVIV